jgi:hypothetical protein
MSLIGIIAVDNGQIDISDVLVFHAAKINHHKESGQSQGRHFGLGSPSIVPTGQLAIRVTGGNNQ